MTDTGKDGALDAWAQPVFRRVRERLPEVARLFEKSGSADMLDRHLGPDDLVALMDAAGMERMLLSAWCRPEGWLCTNDEIAEFGDAYPDRFTGVAAVDLADPVAAVRELERAVVELGCKALRVVPWLWKLPPNDRHYYPLFVKCVELESHSAPRSGTPGR